MRHRRNPVLALGVAALVLAASGYGATTGVHGLRASDRPSTGSCGHHGCKPPKPPKPPAPPKPHDEHGKKGK